MDVVTRAVRASAAAAPHGGQRAWPSSAGAAKKTRKLAKARAKKAKQAAKIKELRAQLKAARREKDEADQLANGCRERLAEWRIFWERLWERAFLRTMALIYKLARPPRSSDSAWGGGQ